MLPTHALWGMALAVPVVVLAPEFAGIALVAGFLGGIVPDLDMYVGHRKTLHYPVYYSALAIPMAVTAILVPTGVAVGVAFFLLGASSHSVSDVFGSGLELRPWEATSDRAVYDHHRDRWIAPRRWIRYDGSPEDLVVSVAIAVPLLTVVEGNLRWIVVATLAVGAVYTVTRRILPGVAVFLVQTLPDHALAYVPARYLEDGNERPLMADR